MRSFVSAIPLLCAALLGGCASKGSCPPEVAAANKPPSPDWHDVITDNDHKRLRAWRDDLTAALDQARKDGHGAQIDADGALLDPDVSLDDVMLMQGDYHCRMIKLGSVDDHHPTYLATAPEDCVIRPSGSIVRLTQTAGVQRVTGRLFLDDDGRQVFLGSMVLSDETAPIKYGRDPDRDMVGAVQRIGPRRWRILLPAPSWGSKMNVLELTPAV